MTDEKKKLVSITPEAYVLVLSLAKEYGVTLQWVASTCLEDHLSKPFYRASLRTRCINNLDAVRSNPVNKMQRQIELQRQENEELKATLLALQSRMEEYGPQVR